MLDTLYLSKNTFVTTGSIISQSVFHLFPGRKPINFYCCTQKDPRPDSKEILLMNLPLGYTLIFMIAAYLATSIRILLSKIRPEVPEPERSAWRLPSIRKLVEENLLLNMPSVGVGIIFYATYVIGYRKVNRIILPDEINEDYNYIWLQFFIHVPPFLWNILTITMVFRKSPKIRQTFCTEIKEIFQSIFRSG